MKKIFEIESIRDIIPQVIENISAKKPNSNRNINDVWKTLAKEHADHSMVRDFQKGILWVYVDSSARMFQLSTQKMELIKNLKKEIADLTDIAFKVGKIK